MSTLKADTLGNTAGTRAVPMATVVDGSAKAWVNFNGAGTVAIRASFNVSSITDNGVGNYTVNFTAAMPDANYSFVTACAPSGVSNSTCIPISQATTSCLIATLNQVPALFDSALISVAIFR